MSILHPLQMLFGMAPHFFDAIDMPLSPRALHGFRAMEKRFAAVIEEDRYRQELADFEKKHPRRDPEDLEAGGRSYAPLRPLKSRTPRSKG